MHPQYVACPYTESEATGRLVNITCRHTQSAQAIEHRDKEHDEGEACSSMADVDCDGETPDSHVGDALPRSHAVMLTSPRTV